MLSRGLNKLNEDEEVKGYGLSKWSPRINHLVYADDIILFCSGKKGSMIKMLKVFRDYELVSRQKINKGKSYFYLHDITPFCVAIRLRRLTRIKQGNFSLHIWVAQYIMEDQNQATSKTLSERYQAEFYHA